MKGLNSTCFAAALAASLIAGACSDDETSGDKTPEGEEGGDPAGDLEREEDAGPAPDDAADHILLSPEQMGPLRAGESVEEEALASRFPDLEVARAEHSREGIPIPAFELSAEGEPQLKVLLTKRGDLTEVLVLSERVATSGGLSVGASYDELVEAYETIRCARGVENYGESLLCHPPESPNLQWVFPVDIDEVSARGDTRPDRAKQALEGRKARQVRWLPPSDNGGSEDASSSAGADSSGTEAGEESELPDAAVSALEGVREAADARAWGELEELMAERFTTRVDPKREPRQKAIAAWKEEPSQMEDLVSLIDARDEACELQETAPPDSYTYVECQLPDNPYRIVFKRSEGTYRFTHMMPAGV